MARKTRVAQEVPKGILKDVEGHCGLYFPRKENREIVVEDKLLQFLILELAPPPPNYCRKYREVTMKTKGGGIL